MIVLPMIYKPFLKALSLDDVPETAWDDDKYELMKSSGSTS